ncbi:Scr1 family TA system antitoxin-like transcriptional regulator [Nocardia farcinica]|uniref:Scr1 family TA system antitoxin-like transcriptional regulator n=1 Tax=Nocardia farcinica TaxID=37329 RepID=UPI0024576468|nr:Scr1 family TA system antitoxin-like transcriptional regulator [Nocardia farcinica]
MSCYQPELVPPLLQTPDYARALLRLARPSVFMVPACARPRGGAGHFFMSRAACFRRWDGVTAIDDLVGLTYSRVGVTIGNS